MLRRRPLKPRHQNILATVTGLVLGAILNSLLIELGPRLIPVPAGLDMSSMEGIRRSMPQLPAANFLFPWLAARAGDLWRSTCRVPTCCPRGERPCSRHWGVFSGRRDCHGGCCRRPPVVPFARPRTCLPPNGLAGLPPRIVKVVKLMTQFAGFGQALVFACR
jgi:hypothetical protein